MAGVTVNDNISLGYDEMTQVPDHVTSINTPESSTLGHDGLVQYLNDKMADLMVPAVVYIVILMVTGIIGNVMVCFYYGFKTKLTPNSLFVVVLATYDLVVCLVCMPTEIADIELYYTFTNDAACKTLRLLNYFAGIGSILTLVAIAVDRFRRIRKPTSRQMSIRTAAIVSAVLIFVAVLLSWPTVVLYGSIEVEIPNTLEQNLTGFDCTSTKDRAYRPYVWAFYGVHVVMFIICAIILVAMYAIIGSTISSHRRRMSKYTKTNQHQMSLHSQQGSRSKENNSQKELLSVEQRAGKGDRRSNEGQSKSEFKHDKETKKETNDNSRSSIDSETIKVTIVMIAITTLFILSFLPYLSLSVWRVMKGAHEAQFLSDAGLVGFKIGTRSFLLNSALNPWIYGIFNSQFRQYFYNLFCCKEQ